MTKELLLVAEVVSNEKGIGKEVVFEAIAAALESATKKKYKSDLDIRVDFDTKTGEHLTFRRWEIVEDDELEHPDREVGLTDKKVVQAGLSLGEYLEEPIESVAFGRISAQVAKQVIMQKVREAERQLIVEQYTPRIGEIITGVVKRTTRDFILLDLGGTAEASLARSDMLPQDIFRPGDRARAHLFDVRLQPRGSLLYVDRVKPEMLIELFKIEVPEVGEGVIEIKAAARDPGSRAKIAVKTNDRKNTEKYKK